MHYLSLNRENVLVSNLEEQLINHTVDSLPLIPGSETVVTTSTLLWPVK